jgi:DNA-directed RNA polymerase sigma subunit (sigma70/sigma32)
MTCPSCGDEFSLKEWLMHTYVLLLPDWLYRRMEQRRERKILDELHSFYYMGRKATLTDREHQVCTGRVLGHSYEAIAEGMNVTRERVRQIEAKALRKMHRANGQGGPNEEGI